MEYERYALTAIDQVTLKEVTLSTESPVEFYGEYGRVYIEYRKLFRTVGRITKHVSLDMLM